MKRLAALLLCLAPVFALASIGDPTWGTAVQSSATTCVASVAGVTAGDTIVVAASNRQSTGAPTGIADDVNGAWTVDATRGIAHGAEGMNTALYFFPGSGAGGGTVTVTVTWVASEIHVCHVARITPTGTITLSDTATGSSNAATSHPLSTTLDIVSNGLAIANSVSASGLTKSVATNFIQAANDGGLRQFAQSRNITGGGGLSDNVAWTSTTNGNNALCGIVLTESAGASGLLLRRRRN
jgi:hypothetical protein